MLSPWKTVGVWSLLPELSSGSQGLLPLFEADADVEVKTPGKSSAMSADVSEEIEVEAKFIFGRDSALPDLSQVAPLGPIAVSNLNALYFDTPELQLQALGVALRRRSGGADAGWHLKMKSEADGEKIEVHAPITGARPPMSLRNALPESVRMSPLLPVARLETRRVETPLLSPRGAVLATLCDDEVRADTSLEAASGESERPFATWHEVEVELGMGDRRVLTHLSRVLLSSGLLAAPYGSKISRALEKWPRSVWNEQKTPTSTLAVQGYVCRQVGLLQALEDGVRSGEEDAVHRSRVAARRLRSTLGTFPILFPESLRSHLTSELRWYGGVLSEMRDTQVLQEKLSLESEGGIAGQGVDVVFNWLDEDEAVAVEVAREELASPRFELLHDLLVLLVDPRRRKAGPAMPGDLVEVLLGTGWARPIGRTCSRMLRALEEGDNPDLLAQGMQWHTVRKAAKSVRYAYEALLGEDAQRTSVWRQVTSTLGDLQDSVFAINTLGSLREQVPSRVTDGDDSSVSNAIAGLMEVQYGRLSTQIASSELALQQALSQSVGTSCP